MATNTFEPVLTAGTAANRVADLSGQVGSHTHRRISWPAIFGGVILVVALQLLLSLLAAGIGLGTIHIMSGQTPDASTLGLGAGLWWVVSSCLAMLIGGYVSAWLAGVEIRFDGVLHGLVAWSIATLLTVGLLSSAIGGIVGGGFSALRGLASGAASSVGAVAKPLADASGESQGVLQQQVSSYLHATDTDPATMSPQDAQKAAVMDLSTYIAGGADAPAAKQRIIAIMAAQMKISPDQATQQFNDTEAKIKLARDQTVQDAKAKADAAAAEASKSFYIAFSVLLLGLVSAGVGGSLAVQRRLLTVRMT